MLFNTGLRLVREIASVWELCLVERPGLLSTYTRTRSTFLGVTTVKTRVEGILG